MARKSSRSKTPTKKKRALSQSVKKKQSVSKKKSTLSEKTFPLSALIKLVVWVLIGTFWYKWNCSWALSKSFYYASQAGLNVGFGLYSESTDCSHYSKLFTSVYCLFGVHAGGSALCEVVFIALIRRLVQANICTCLSRSHGLLWVWVMQHKS